MRVFMFLWRLSLTGGIPRVARSLIGRIDHERFDLQVCTARPLVAEDRLGDLGTEVQFTSLGMEGRVSRKQQLQTAFALRHEIERHRPDVVHTHSGVGWYLLPWLLSTRPRVPAILEVHDSPQSLRVSKGNHALEGLMIRRFGVTPLVHSHSVRHDLAEAARIDADRIKLIPIGIDTAEFDDDHRRQELRRSLALTPEDVVVTYVARLVASKNPRLFLDVARDVISQRPQTRFLLVGDGPERERVEATAAGLEGRFSVLSGIARVSDALAASDIFLSTSEYEGFGIAVLEAMACGLPVVSLSAGGVDDLISSGSGILIPTPSAQLLSDAVISLVDDSRVRSSMGSRARERARGMFDLSGMVRSYEDLYTAVSQGASWRSQGHA